MHLFSYFYVISLILHMTTSFLTDGDVSKWSSLNISCGPFPLDKMKEERHLWDCEDLTTEQDQEKSTYSFAQTKAKNVCVITKCIKAYYDQLVEKNGSIEQFCPEDMKTAMTIFCERNPTSAELIGECYYNQCKKILIAREEDEKKNMDIPKNEYDVELACKAKDQLSAQDKCYGEVDFQYDNTEDYYKCVENECYETNHTIAPELCMQGMFQHVKAFCLALYGGGSGTTVSCINKLCHIFRTQDAQNEEKNILIAESLQACTDRGDPKITTDVNYNCMNSIYMAEDDEMKTKTFYECLEKGCSKERPVSEKPCPYDITLFVEEFCKYKYEEGRKNKNKKGTCYKAECAKQHEIRKELSNEDHAVLVEYRDIMLRTCEFKDDRSVGAACYKVETKQINATSFDTKAFFQCMIAKCKETGGDAVPVNCPDEMNQAAKRYCIYKYTDAEKQTTCYAELCKHIRTQLVVYGDYGLVEDAKQKAVKNCQTDRLMRYRAEDTCMRAMNDFMTIKTSSNSFYNCLSGKCRGSEYLMGSAFIVTDNFVDENEDENKDENENENENENKDENENENKDENDDKNENENKDENEDKNENENKDENENENKDENEDKNENENKDENELVYPDHPRPSQTIPHQTIPHQTRPDQTRPDQTKPNQTEINNED